MEVKSITLTMGKFIPSESDNVEERLLELEKYLALLTEELEARTNNPQ